MTSVSLSSCRLIAETHVYVDEGVVRLCLHPRGGSRDSPRVRAIVRRTGSAESHGRSPKRRERLGPLRSGLSGTGGAFCTTPCPNACGTRCRPSSEPRSIGHFRTALWGTAAGMLAGSFGHREADRGMRSPDTPNTSRPTGNRRFVDRERRPCIPRRRMRKMPTRNIG